MPSQGTGPENALRPGSRIRVAALAAAGLFALQLGWVLVLPPATGIDEFDHVFRASAVSLGHWGPGTEHLPPMLARGGLLPVRADIVEAAGPACARLPYTKPFNCRAYRHLGRDVDEVASGVDPYNPLYYAVVGTLARPFTGTAAIDVMRLVTALGCAGMFGIAVLLTTGWARTRWPVALLLVGCLPTTVYSTSIASPNGVQMMSGILVWAALAALVRGTPALRRAAYPALMGGAAIMANSHTLGLLWLALIGVSLAIWVGFGGALRMVRPRNRLEVLVSGAAGLAVAFQLWWMWFARPNVGHPEGGVAGSPWGPILRALVLWPLQAIAAFPYRNEAAPAGVYGGALAILSCLVAMTIMALKGRHRLTLVTVFALLMIVAVPVLISYAGFHRYGMSWQGRYGMPYAVGLFVLAGIALDDNGVRLRGGVIVIAAVVWGAVQTLGQLGVLAKQLKDGHLVAATGWWSPPVFVIVLLGAVAGLLWFASLRVGEPHSRLERAAAKALVDDAARRKRLARPTR